MALLGWARPSNPSRGMSGEPGGAMVWEVSPKNPFAVFGGLGG